MLLLLGCTCCGNKNSVSLNLPVDLFNNMDKQSCIVSYYNFDCSSCISAMEKSNEVLKEYTNVYYVISSSDSVRTYYYLEQINPHGTIIFDKNLQFVKENGHLDFYSDYPIFVIKNGRVIFHENPFKGFISEIMFKQKIRNYKSTSSDT